MEQVKRKLGSLQNVPKLKRQNFQELQHRSALTLTCYSVAGSPHMHGSHQSVKGIHHSDPKISSFPPSKFIRNLLLEGREGVEENQEGKKKKRKQRNADRDAEGAAVRGGHMERNVGAESSSTPTATTSPASHPAPSSPSMPPALPSSSPSTAPLTLTLSLSGPLTIILVNSSSCTNLYFSDCFFFSLSLGKLDRDVFVEIEVGRPVVVADPDGDFTVTAYGANHCPGAVMFLFEGEFGNMLHTGDCRLTPDCLHNLPLKYIAKRARETVCYIDYLFLDCTFGRCSLKFPSKKSAIQQVINCIWKQPGAPVVYLACDLLGQEEILIEVWRTFGSKMYVDKASNSECYHALSQAAPEILTDDASSRFQVIEFPKLSEQASKKLAIARANHQPEPLFIRPSMQWYANGISEAETDPDGS